MSRLLAELSGPALAATLTEDSVIVIPTGSIEHHGPHLPLFTDLLMAEQVSFAAVDAAVAAGVDAWLLPSLAYMKSDEHHWAPGTMWLRYDTVMETLIDIGRSIAATPAKKVVFLNAHGGNIAILQVAIRELRRQFGLQTFVAGFPIEAGDGETGPDELGFGIHAGFGETSLILHLRPDLVDLELGVRSVPEHLASFEHVGFANKPVVFGWTSDDFGTDGTVGDPTGANAAHGKVIFDASVALMTESLVEIARFRP